jgi:hypothetical protein
MTDSSTTGAPPRRSVATLLDCISDPQAEDRSAPIRITDFSVRTAPPAPPRVVRPRPPRGGLSRVRGSVARPNFLIIGAAKAGTTSLYHYLGQHPDVYVSPIKEPRYYCDEEQVRDLSAVRSREAYESLFSGARAAQAIGEATSSYLNTVAGLGRMHADLPGVRLIVSLRHPVDRAYSSYLARCVRGVETSTPEEALRPGHIAFEASLYSERLKRYFRRFPRRHVHVILFDDLVARPQDIVRDVFRFLGVDPAFDADTTTRHNPALVPRFARLNRTLASTLRVARRMAPQPLLWKGFGVALRRPLMRAPDPLPRALRSRLLNRYRDDILATAELVGRDLTHWLE